MKGGVARLYYECHITIDPVFDAELEKVSEIAKRHHFKVASLLMQKRKEDTPEQSKYDTFMTGHSKSYDEIYTNMEACVKELHGVVNVRRYKIEDTLFDTRHGDTL